MKDEAFDDEKQYIARKEKNDKTSYETRENKQRSEILQQLAWYDETIIPARETLPLLQTLLQQESLPQMMNENGPLHQYELEDLIRRTNGDIQAIMQRSIEYGLLTDEDMENITQLEKGNGLDLLTSAITRHTRARMFQEQFPEGNIQVIENIDSRLRTAGNLIEYASNIFLPSLKRSSRIDYRQTVLRVESPAGIFVLPFNIDGADTPHFNPENATMLPKIQEETGEETESRALTTENFQLVGASVTCMENAVTTAMSDPRTSDVRILDRAARFLYARNIAETVNEAHVQLQSDEIQTVRKLTEAYRPNSSLDLFEQVAQIEWGSQKDKERLYIEFINSQLTRGKRLEHILEDIARGSNLAYELHMTSIPAGSLAERFVKSAVQAYRTQPPLDFARESVDFPTTIHPNELDRTIHVARYIAEKEAQKGEKYRGSLMGDLIAAKYTAGQEDLETYLRQEGILESEERFLQIPERPSITPEMPPLPTVSEDTLTETAIAKRARTAVDNLEKLFPEIQRRKGENHTATLTIENGDIDHPEEITITESTPANSDYGNRTMTINRRHMVTPGDPHTYVQDMVHIDESSGTLGMNKKVILKNGVRRLINHYGESETYVTLDRQEDLLAMIEDIVKHSKKIKQKNNK